MTAIHRQHRFSDLPVCNPCTVDHCRCLDHLLPVFDRLGRQKRTCGCGCQLLPAGRLRLHVPPWRGPVLTRMQFEQMPEQRYTWLPFDERMEFARVGLHSGGWGHDGERWSCEDFDREGRDHYHLVGVRDETATSWAEHALSGAMLRFVIVPLPKQVIADHGLHDERDRLRSLPLMEVRP